MLMKGCLHTHTTCSDGTLTPQQVALIYEEKGYDFIALTDHDYLLKPGFEKKIAVKWGIPHFTAKQRAHLRNFFSQILEFLNVFFDKIKGILHKFIRSDIHSYRRGNFFDASPSTSAQKLTIFGKESATFF